MSVPSGTGLPDDSEGPEHETSEDVRQEALILDRAIGGWRGVIDSGVPTAVFVVAYVVTSSNLRTSLIAAIVAGGLIAVWRLIRREPLTQIGAGFVGLLFSAWFASRTQNASDVYLPGMLTNLGYGTAFLARVVGEKKAREIWYMCRRYSGQEAVAMGLANICVPHEQLDATVQEWAETICERSPTAIAIAKRSFNMDTAHQAGIAGMGMYALKLYYDTEESREGVKALQEKRKPDKHLVGRRLAGSQCLPQKGHDDNDSDKRCHHEEHGWQQRDCRHQQHDLDVQAVARGLRAVGHRIDQRHSLCLRHRRRQQQK